MSANRVNQTTGELIQYSGDVPTDKVGNLSSATTTDKSSVVAMVNELNGNFNNLKYRKIAESASTGTYAQKLQSLATSYNALSAAQRLSTLLVANDADIFQPINCSGNWFTIWIESAGAWLIRHGIDGSSYSENINNIVDNSSTEDTKVFSLWICEP